MRQPVICLLLALLLVVAGGRASLFAHEVRPAYLQITESAAHQVDVLWKQPAVGPAALHLVPHISGGLLEQAPAAQAAADFHLRIWRHLDAGADGLEGREIRIEGLEQTITDVLVSMRFADGSTSQHILTPREPVFTLRRMQQGASVSAYLRLGLEHILTGVDHLAFILCLVLLVGPGWKLVKTLTAFTLAHSITLAATALHWISPQPALIEAWVALSIVIVAVELARSLRGNRGWTAQRPWPVALLFGLLHGSAFAGALSQIGLPSGAIAPALLLFNVGVEVGQLLFVAMLVGAGWAWRRLTDVPAWSRWIAPYAVGSVAAFWFFERLQAALA
jgi:hypothetical protein